MTIEPTEETFRFHRPPMINTNIWLDTFNGDMFAHWMFLYEFRFETKLPGVLTFGSFPSLLDYLLNEDLDDIRRRMRVKNEADCNSVLGWYRTVALQLLGASYAADPSQHLHKAVQGASG